MIDSGSNPSEALLVQVANGEVDALENLLTRYRPYVRRIVDARLDPALRVRVDPSDVVQEALMTASRRIDDFLQRRPTSFRIWLRRKVLEQLVDTRRRHFAQKRDVRRELRLGSASSLSIAGGLLGDKVSEIVAQQELLEKVETAIGEISESDREVLLMRHGEELTNTEVAEALNIDPKAASMRYARAVRQLAAGLRRLAI